MSTPTLKSNLRLRNRPANTEAAQTAEVVEQTPVRAEETKVSEVVNEEITMEVPEEMKTGAPVPPSFMMPQNNDTPKEETPKEETVAESKVVHKQYGSKVEADNKISEGNLNEDIIQTRDIRKVNETKFFSENHKASVEKINALAENARGNISSNIIDDNVDFMALFNNGFKDSETITGDDDYAVAAARPVVGATVSSYIIVLLHSGYQATMSSLQFLDKSRLNMTAASTVQNRERLFKIIYDKIIDMTCGKPSFEKWLKMTGIRDLDPLLYGIYAATYPTSQSFNIECEKCHTSLSVATNPENIVAVYDEGAYEQVRDIINDAASTDSIINNSVLSKIEAVPFKRRKTAIYIREPSLADFLEVIRFIEKNESKYDGYEEVFEQLMFIKYVMIPDTAYYKEHGKLRYIRTSNLAIIANILATADDDESNEIKKVIDNLNEIYAVKYELPKIKCTGIKKDKNGNLTTETCGHEIGPMPLDMEELLFFRLRPKQ